MSTNSENSLDILWGATQIADYLGCGKRKVFHLLETGRLPARKVGKVWTTTRSQLKKFFDGEGAKAPTVEMTLPAA